MTPQSDRTENRVELSVGPEAAGTRLDLFLAGRLRGLSRSRIKRLVEKGGVRVAGKEAKPGQKLATGETVSVGLPSPEEAAPRPELIPLDFLYRDDSLAVINKPPGLLVHPLRSGQGGTLVNALLHHLGPLPETGSPLRPGIVHRLDRDTSGVMVCARTEEAWEDLGRQFRARTVEKEYLALARGRPPAAEGECTFPIGRSPTRRTRMTIRAGTGRPARTLYRLEEEFSGVSLLRLKILTGRTHQIRVHLARLGCPVLGDPVYGGKRRGEYPTVPRQMLHARRLQITHPITGEPMEWIAPLPGDMESILAHLRSVEKPG